MSYEDIKCLETSSTIVLEIGSFVLVPVQNYM